MSPEHCIGNVNRPFVFCNWTIPHRHKDYEPTTSEQAVEAEFVFAVTLNVVLLSSILEPKYVYTFFISFITYMYAASVELIQ